MARNFVAQPFAGIGDPGAMEYRQYIENQMQKASFAPFSGQGFVLPDNSADLRLMEELVTQGRESDRYVRSPAFEQRRALEWQLPRSDSRP